MGLIWVSLFSSVDFASIVHRDSLHRQYILHSSVLPVKMTSHLSSYNMQVFTVYQKDDQIFDTEKINCTLKRWKISRARKSVTHVLCSCCIYICCFLYMHVCTLPNCIHMHHILDQSNKLKEKNQLELITVLCTYVWLGSMQRRRAFLSCLGIGTHVGSLTMTQPLLGY